MAAKRRAAYSSFMVFGYYFYYDCYYVHASCFCCCENLENGSLSEFERVKVKIGQSNGELTFLKPLNKLVSK